MSAETVAKENPLDPNIFSDDDYPWADCLADMTESRQEALANRDWRQLRDILKYPSNPWGESKIVRRDLPCDGCEKNVFDHVKLKMHFRTIDMRNLTFLEDKFQNRQVWGDCTGLPRPWFDGGFIDHLPPEEHLIALFT